MTYNKLPIQLINKYIWDLASGLVDGTAVDTSVINVENYSLNGTTSTVSGITFSGEISTVTTTAPHGVIANQLCKISGVNAYYDKNHRVLSTPTPTTFTIAKPTLGSSAAGGGTVKEIGLFPFYPVAENSGANTDITPFVIYDFLFTPPSNTQWFIDCEKAVYTIVGELPQIYYFRNFIYETLKKFDISAQAVNEYVQDDEIKFKFIKCEQSNYMIDEKRIDSFKPKFVTSLILTYDYTKS
jgi:hypothetical protein